MPGAALNDKAKPYVEPLDVSQPGHHAISPGPLKTQAAAGLKDFDLLLNDARRLTGNTVYVDGGVNIMA